MPGVITVTCLCGAGQETLRHIALYCTHKASNRHYLGTHKPKPDVPTNDRHEQRGKTLRTMDDVLREAKAIYLS
jgi:hypothetical protein